MNNTALFLSVFLLSFAVTFLLERLLIPFLRSKAKQPIYTDGPEWHMRKSGTPTMGGLGFIGAIALTLAFASFFMFESGDRNNALLILYILVFSLLNASIGIIDDLTKLKRKANGGLTAAQKLVLQFLVTGIFLFLINSSFWVNTSFDFGLFSIETGFMYFPIIAVLLVGSVNCCNLTDGVDGLACSVALTAGVMLTLIFLNETSAFSLASLALVGGMLGFLLFNINPAKIFMGDTGSLFLGALTVSFGFGFKNPFLILPILGVYFIEGASVILQVVVFKLSGRRVFKMAPLHHHLEINGFNESKICLVAVIATLVLSLISILCVR